VERGSAVDCRKSESHSACDVDMHVCGRVKGREVENLRHRRRARDETLFARQYEYPVPVPASPQARKRNHLNPLVWLYVELEL